MFERHAYFTAWAFSAVLASYVAIAAARLSQRAEHMRPAFGTFIVATSLVICAVGSEIVCNRLIIPAKHMAPTMRAHLLMHMMMLVATVYLLGGWRHVVGRPCTCRDAQYAALGLLVLFAAWMCTPARGHIGLEKIRAVYCVEHPALYVAVGSLVALTGVACCFGVGTR